MRYGTRKGFTIVEFLVVVAIIGILAGIIIPVLSRAMEEARRRANPNPTPVMPSRTEAEKPSIPLRTRGRNGLRREP
jgi:prepilin-type N-terminal cleavage/methylation domain-containing protein